MKTKHIASGLYEVELPSCPPYKVIDSWIGSPWQPTGNRVLIQRIEEPSRITLAHAAKGIKGIVLAVGPGKRDEDGEIVPLDVQPGDKVLFNSRWNDFAHAEHGRPLSAGADPMLHLVTEGDIIAKVPHFDFSASIKIESPSENIEIKGPWNS